VEVEAVLCAGVISNREARQEDPEDEEGLWELLWEQRMSKHQERKERGRSQC
jgi:hypothetical protein